MNSTPGVYGGSRRPTVKYGKFCPRERNFSEDFEVPRLKGALSRVCILRSENSLGSKFAVPCKLKFGCKRLFLRVNSS